MKIHFVRNNLRFLIIFILVNFINVNFSYCYSQNLNNNIENTNLDILGKLKSNYVDFSYRNFVQTGYLVVVKDQKSYRYNVKITKCNNDISINLIPQDNSNPAKFLSDLPLQLNFTNNSFKSSVSLDSQTQKFINSIGQIIKAQAVVIEGFNNSQNLLFLGDSKHNENKVYLVKDAFNNDSSATLILNHSNFKINSILFNNNDNNTDVVEFNNLNNNNLPQEISINNNDFNLTYKISDTVMACDNATKIVNIPFKFIDNNIVIDCILNNSVKVKAVFSSAFKNSVIDTKFAYANNLMKMSDPSTTGFVISQIKVDNLKISDFSIDNFSFKLANLDSLASSQHCDMIFGLDIFTNTNICIDYNNKLISFNYDYGKFTNTFNWSCDSPQIFMTLYDKNHNPLKLDLLVDTGASFNYLFNKISIDNDSVLQYSSQITALTPDNQLKLLSIVNFKDAMVGNSKANIVSFRYPCENSKNINSYQGILSNQFFKDYLLVLDQKNKKIALEKNELILDEFTKLINAGNKSLLFDRDYRASENYYQLALIKAGKNNHNNIIALERLGNLRRVMGHDLNRPSHYKTSYIILKKALSLAKFYQEIELTGLIYSDLAVLYAYDGQLNSVLPLVITSLKLAPNNNNVLVNASLCEIKLNKINEASQNLNKVLFFDPSNWQGLWFNYKIASLKHDQLLATQTLNSIIFFYPWSKLAKKLLDK